MQLVTNVNPEIQIAQWVLENRWLSPENGGLSSHEFFYEIIRLLEEHFIAKKDIDDILFFARNDDNLELEKDAMFYSCDDYDGKNPIPFERVYKMYLTTKTK